MEIVALIDFHMNFFVTIVRNFLDQFRSKYFLEAHQFLIEPQLIKYYTVSDPT